MNDDKPFEVEVISTPPLHRAKIVLTPHFYSQSSRLLFVEGQGTKVTLTKREVNSKDTTIEINASEAVKLRDALEVVLRGIEQ